MKRKTPLSKIGTDPALCSTDLRLRLLGNLVFFQGVPLKELTEINGLFVDRGYAPGELIYLEASPAERLYVLVDGKVKLTKFGANHKEVLLSILQRGEFFGAFTASAKALHTESAIAIAQTCAISISLGDFQKVMSQKPALAMRSMQIMAEKLNESTEQVLLLSSMSLEQRLAYILLGLDAKFGVNRGGLRVIDVPLSREELAGMTASTPETVSRWMSAMKKEGVIESGRRWVSLLKPKVLEDLLEKSV